MTQAEINKSDAEVFGIVNGAAQARVDQAARDAEDLKRAEEEAKERFERLRKEAEWQELKRQEEAMVRAEKVKQIFWLSIRVLSCSVIVAALIVSTYLPLLATVLTGIGIQAAVIVAAITLDRYFRR